MQGIVLIINGLGWTMDFVLLLLDMNYWLVSSLLSVLLWTIRTILNLPGAVGVGLLHCWECVVLGVSIVGEYTYGLLLGVVQAGGDVMRGAVAGLDTLHLVWNLLCHMAIRSREVMQRGFINVMVFGQNLHCQFWEVLTIASSLTAYLVNTVVNLSLIAVQNILSAALSLWFSIVNVIFASKELISVLCSQLSSSAVAVVVLVWAPFQMAADVLVSCSTGVGVLVFSYVYECLLLLLIIWASRIVLNPSPAMRPVHDALGMLCRVVRTFLYVLINSDVWRRLAGRIVYLLRIFRTTWNRDVNQLRTRTQRLRTHYPAGPTQTHSPSVVRLLNPTPQPTYQHSAGFTRVQTTQEVHHRTANACRNQIPQAVLHEPQCTASTSRNTESTVGDPWKLLKQQEESRKCVICQDEIKTVLLLPCRHLCLCAHCTQILMQQPILQRNCPLCRQMILQTLTVYM